MSIELVDVILLLAAVQGLLLSVLIIIRHRRLFANRFLAILLLVYTFMLLHLLITELNEMTFLPHYTVAFIGIGFVLPPLHYLYAKYLVYGTKKWENKDWLHFLLPMLYEVCQLPLLLKSSEQLALYMRQHQILDVPVFSVVYNWIIIFQASIYMYYTFRVLYKYVYDIKNVFSSIEKIRLNWLLMNTKIMTLFLIIFATENVFLLNGINLTNNFTLSSALLAIYVYALGYMGLIKSEVFKGPAIASTLSQLSEFSDPYAEIKKYEKSGLSEEKADRIHEELIRYMQTDEPFINSDLTLNQLARLLKISPHNLSQVLNTRLNLNFFDFVNQYRLDKVKKDLMDPQYQHLTVLAIAFNAGFNSKSSFNTIFKKQTGQTPSQYRQN